MASINVSVVRQPICDENGVEFAARLAENSTPLWSHHTILRRDETWLPEWSGKLGEWSGVPSGRAGCPGASQSFGLRVGPLAESLAWGPGANFSATERAHGGTEARLTRNGGCQVWSRLAGHEMKRRISRILPQSS